MDSGNIITGVIWAAFYVVLPLVFTIRFLITRFFTGDSGPSAPLRPWRAFSPPGSRNAAVGNRPVDIRPAVSDDLAGFWARALAYVIDIAILSLIDIGLTRLYASSLGGQGPSAGAALSFLGISLTVTLTYYIYLTGAYGATLGKMAIGARVVMMNGSAVGFGVSALRYFCYTLSALPAGAGFFMVGFTPEKRALHDLMCGTKVIYGKSKNIPPAPAAQFAGAAQTSEDPLTEADILAGVADPASCLAIARHYAGSGRVQQFMDQHRGKTPAFYDAYGKAFLRLGHYDAVQALVEIKGNPNDIEIIRVMERARRTLGVRSIFGAAQGFITKLTAAVELSQRKLHDWAFCALDDEVLRTAAGGEAECMQVAEIYRAAGKTPQFLTEKSAGQSPEFTGAYASAFFALGEHAAALALLHLRPRIEPERIGMYVLCHKTLNAMDRLLAKQFPQEHRVRYAQALMDAAEDASAFGLLKRAPRESWGSEDFALSLRLCDRLDDFKSAAEIFTDMQDSVAVKDGPDLYYRYALICEKEGRIDLSQGIYEKIRKRFPDFRDVTARLEKLAAIPSSEKTRLSTIATSQLGANPSLASAAVPRELANKFEIRKVLGIGGFGVVYKGWDRNLSRDVAIKVLNRRLQPDERARAAFLEEAKMVAALSHPYIVAIHDIVALKDDNYLIFEFVDGEPLSKIVSSRGSLGHKECARALIFVAEALAYAHSSGVIHQDLKPANLMWDKRGFVKVMDFGLAFQAGGKAASGGTLPYMAPEQHQSRGTAQSDVFSLGATAYELLTGNLPFTGPDYRAQKNRERYAPLGDKVPPALRNLVQSCLKPDPAARPKGMAAVRSALRGMG